MKAAVLGVGRMGTAIVCAMKKLGFEVLGLDSNEHAATNFRKYISGPDGAFYLTNQNNANKSIEAVLLHEKPDIVISSLPYHQTGEIAMWCIINRLRYCDLGGRVDISKEINNFATQEATKPVFTDLGLAPGWVNIMAEQGYKKIGQNADTVLMYVGGLPKRVDFSNPLKYEATWSVDGLINEYIDDCEILNNGIVTKVKGMGGWELVDFMGNTLEAFYTSGGASHSVAKMEERGVKNCCYKTLRYQGHLRFIKFLINKCELGRECLDKIFLDGCPTTEHGDLVFIKAVVRKGVSPCLEWKHEIQINSGEGFSAMQRATAFPISAVASLMAEGNLEGDKDQRRDYWTQYPKALTYSEVPFDKFYQKLKLLGLDIEKGDNILRGSI